MGARCRQNSNDEEGDDRQMIELGLGKKPLGGGKLLVNYLEPKGKYFTKVIYQ